MITWNRCKKSFHPNFHISHVGTKDLPTDMTLEEISEKNISFSKHLKLENNEVICLGIAQRGDSCKVKAEALKKLLCTKYNMHFIFRSNINVKWYLNRSNLRLNRHDMPTSVRNSKKRLRKFDSVWLQNKHLFTTGHGSFSSESSESYSRIIVTFWIFANKEFKILWII